MNVLRNLTPSQHSQVEAFFQEHVHDNIQKEFHEVVGLYLQGTIALVDLMEKLVAILGWHSTHKLLHFIREELKIQVDEPVQRLMDSLKPSTIAAQVLSKRFNTDDIVEQPKNKRKERKETAEESSAARKRSKSNQWTTEEDDLLKELVNKYPKEQYSNQWTLIAKHFPKRDQASCYQHWHRVVRPGIKKGRWSIEEEELLGELVERQLLLNKKVSWAKIASEIEGRIDTSCRYMWKQIVHSRAVPWKEIEDTELLCIISSYGEKDLDWDQIAQTLQNNLRHKVLATRTALDCKQRFMALTGIKAPKSRPATKKVTKNKSAKRVASRKVKTLADDEDDDEDESHFSESDSEAWSDSSDSE